MLDVGTDWAQNVPMMKNTTTNAGREIKMGDVFYLSNQSTAGWKVESWDATKNMWRCFANGHGVWYFTTAALQGAAEHFSAKAVA